MCWSRGLLYGVSRGVKPQKEGKKVRVKKSFRLASKAQISLLYAEAVTLTNFTKPLSAPLIHSEINTSQKKRKQKEREKSITKEHQKTRRK